MEPTSTQSTAGADERRIQGEMLNATKELSRILKGVRLNRNDGLPRDLESAIEAVQPLAEVIKRLDAYLDEFRSFEDLSIEGALTAEAVETATTRFWELFAELVFRHDTAA